MKLAYHAGPKIEVDSSISGHLQTCGVGTGQCECVATAIHEAGHAVACLETGVRLRKIDTRRHCGHLGLVWFEGSRSRKSDLLIYLSGPAAEGLAIGSFPMKGTHGDFSYVSKSTDRAQRWELWKQSLIVCARRWSDITKIARVLLGGRPLLFGSDVRSILAGGRS